MISVLLTAYCGEAYIDEQVASILPQLALGDELLISDDSPSMTLQFDDPRVRYLQGPRQGVIANVEFLLTQARGDILVLCDQDDVWLPGKLDAARQLQGCALLVHAAHVTDEQLNISGRAQARPGMLRNILKNSYTGCCMAFTRELLLHVLPFPKGIPMHDQWIALQAQRHGHVIITDEPLILWRRHRGTQTGHRTSLRQKIAWRIAIIKASKGGCR
ncbi:MAG: glycosyltransferase [Oscillospiraceae bacterium]|nr:glycosyltransferase [Oscillospiraceae bacterium]